MGGDAPDSHLETRTGKYLELTASAPDLTSAVSAVSGGGIVDPVTGQPLSLDEAICAVELVRETDVHANLRREHTVNFARLGDVGDA